MIKSFLLSLIFLFIASCTLLPMDEENTMPSTEISLETTPAQVTQGTEKDVNAFNRKIKNAYTNKETWVKHAPEVVLHYAGRDLAAGLTTFEFKSQPERFDYAEVELIQDGLLDDAIKTHKTLIVMKKLPQGYWQLQSAKVFTECYRNNENHRCL